MGSPRSHITQEIGFSGCEAAFEQQFVNLIAKLDPPRAV